MRRIPRSLIALTLALITALPCASRAGASPRSLRDTEAAARALPITEFTYDSPTHFRVVARNADGSTTTLEALGSTRVFGDDVLELTIDGVPVRFHSWFDERFGARVFHFEGSSSAFLVPDIPANRALERGLADLLSGLEPTFRGDADNLLEWREADAGPTLHAGDAQAGGASTGGAATGGGGFWGSIWGWITGKLGGGNGGGLVNVGGGDDITNKGGTTYVIVIGNNNTGSITIPGPGSTGSGSSGGSGGSTPPAGGNGGSTPPAGGNNGTSDNTAGGGGGQDAGSTSGGSDNSSAPTE